MKLRIQIIFSFLLIMILGFVDMQIDAQTILIKPDSLYLGKIPFGSTAVRKVEIKNTSSNALNISKIEIINDSGGNFTILNNPGTVSLGQLQDIVLDIQFTPSINDTNKASVSITSNSGTSPDIFSLFAVGSSDSPVTFERLFGEEETDGLSSIEETTDGGYISAGSTLPPKEDFNNFLVAKTDKNGLLEWSQDYGDDEIESANTIVQVGNGNYVVFGETNSDGEGGFDFYLIEINSVGDVVWDKTYGGNKDERAKSMVKTSDGGYLLVGNTRSFGDALSTDVYIIKVTSDGSIVWEKTYGGSGGESPSKVIQTSDNNYVIVGNTASFSESFDAYFLKIDNNGNKIWEKTFGLNEEDEGTDIAELSDGSLVVVGYTVSFGAGAKDIYLLKLDSSGNELWHKEFGGPFQDRGSNIVTDGNSIIFTGTISETLVIARFNIIKTDINGNIIQQFTTKKGSLSMSSGDLLINSDGNLILAGSSGSFSFSRDAYILNTADFKSATSVEVGESIIDDFVLYQNYPNPFNNQTQISFNLNKSEFVELNIYNITGQKVKTLINSYSSAGYYKIGFDGNGLASGIYFLRLTTKSNSLVQSMMLLK